MRPSPRQRTSRPFARISRRETPVLVLAHAFAFPIHGNKLATLSLRFKAWHAIFVDQTIYPADSGRLKLLHDLAWDSVQNTIFGNPTRQRGGQDGEESDREPPRSRLSGARGISAPPPDR